MSTELDTIVRLRHQRDILAWVLKLHHMEPPLNRPRTLPMNYFDDVRHRADLDVLGAVDSYEVVEGSHGRGVRLPPRLPRRSAKADAVTAERRAPVQGWRVIGEREPRKVRGTIPWELHERIWAAYAARYGRDQSAERIAERGGFGYREAQRLLFGRLGLGDDLEYLPELKGYEPTPGARY